MRALKKLCKDLYVKGRSLHADYVIFIIFICIPFLYWPDNPNNLISVARALLLFGVSIVILIHSDVIPLLYVKVLSVGYGLRICAALILILIILSIANSNLDLITSVVGMPPVYLGILSWLSFLILSVHYRKNFLAYISSHLSVVIMSTVIMLSLAVDWFNIYSGVRVSGIILQSTTLSMYALLLLIILLYKISLSKKTSVSKAYIFLCFVSIFTVIMTHSRIGYIGLVVVVAAYSLYFLQNLKLVMLSIFFTVITILSIANLSHHSTSRFSTNMISVGVSYRSSLYYVSFKEIWNNNKLVGIGPAQLPLAVNDRNKVPADLADTLNQSIMFSSTHNMFLDIAYYFGLLVSLLLFIISIYSILAGLLNGNTATFALSIMLIVLFLNGMFNVPSIELTSLYFIALVALLYRLPIYAKLSNA